MSKLLTLTALLAVLVWVVYRFPWLWELGIGGLIGGIYLIFFRQPDRPLD